MLTSSGSRLGSSAGLLAPGRLALALDPTRTLRPKHHRAAETQVQLSSPSPHLAGGWSHPLSLSPWAGCASRPFQQAGKLPLQLPSSGAVMLHLLAPIAGLLFFFLSALCDQTEGSPGVGPGLAPGQPLGVECTEAWPIRI